MDEACVVSGTDAFAGHSDDDVIVAVCVYIEDIDCVPEEITGF